MLIDGKVMLLGKLTVPWEEEIEEVRQRKKALRLVMGDVGFVFKWCCLI